MHGPGGISCLPARCSLSRPRRYVPAGVGSGSIPRQIAGPIRWPIPSAFATGVRPGDDFAVGERRSQDPFSCLRCQASDRGGGMETITGTAAGVPFTALPPAGAVDGPAPLIVTWHMLDAPRTDAAFAAALPMTGVP